MRRQSTKRPLLSGPRKGTDAKTVWLRLVDRVVMRVEHHPSCWRRPTCGSKAAIKACARIAGLGYVDVMR